MVYQLSRDQTPREYIWVAESKGDCWSVEFVDCVHYKARNQSHDWRGVPRWVAVKFKCIAIAIFF